jgi:glycosyltransferase involved in cell wall biosynthesis
LPVRQQQLASAASANTTVLRSRPEKAATRWALMTPKIVHVNIARGFRGGERQTELLIAGLASRRVSQALVARRDGMLARRIAALGVEVRQVGGGLWSVARQTRGASLVHVHEGRSVYAAYLRWWLSRTPYVITRRVDNPIGDHWAAHKAYARAACVAAVAPQVADIVRAYDPSINVRVIHSGSSGLKVDAAAVERIRSQYANRLLVGHVGALDNRQKGQEYIIAVARELESSHPDLVFMLVGGGADEAMLKGLATGLRNVVFTGFVENVGDYLAALDIFVLPSNREGIGSILLDAMERALPVVASRVGGVPEIVHHEENGLLIDPANTAQLRDAVLRLRADPAWRRVLGERGRELAKEFTAERMWSKYFDLYQSLVGKLD